MSCVNYDNVTGSTDNEFFICTYMYVNNINVILTGQISEYLLYIVNILLKLSFF